MKRNIEPMKKPVMEFYVHPHERRIHCPLCQSKEWRLSNNDWLCVNCGSQVRIVDEKNRFDRAVIHIYKSG